MPLVDTLLKTDEEAGLIRTAPKDDTVTGYQADTVRWDNDTDSVMSLVDQVIARNSKPQQRAEQRALNIANRRGMADSTMAIGAGQAAIYDYAVPIAQTDAGNRLTIKQGNAQATNAARAGLAQAMNTSRGITQQTEAEQRLLGTKAEIDLRQLREQGAQERELVRERADQEMRIQTHASSLDEATQVRLQELRGAQALEVTALEQRYRTIQQVTETGGQYWFGLNQSISEILAQPDITLENKQQLVDRLIRGGSAAFTFFSSATNIDFSDVLDELLAGTSGGGTTGGGGAADGRPDWWPPGTPWPPAVA